ncbi:alpha-mannosidase [Deinococcus peraridilitoris]|uniref:Alpha-mannosidase n=1 Tax=Deinococcus peraridilitoris (strain DSM 19664 / LMG 22246 / CIP 109416 / KR-200) TaxID=937777 RepID=K9ZXP7_DEIPD|nr:alpha-mannosidase [Deinococcus peraridilitoris]AFZ65672.1 alpha-mannosidase [Deinococcus peraridilitoris DSM 19664]
MTNPRHKDLTFTLTGHAHLDPVWLWDQQEGIETVKATFRSALDRIKENPDLVFTHTSAAQYAWMQIHPQLMDEIRDAVRRGQWELSGGFWVEPDVNIPSGEALARQGLYGQRFFRQAFGQHCSVAFLPDSFGHPHTLPQILRHCALTSFVFWRPHPHEVELPSNLFWWQGRDGSRILSARLESYNSNPRDLTDSLNAAIPWRPVDSPEWLVVYGVGNHGGGPTRKALSHLRDLMTSPDWPTLQLGTLEGFFERARTRDHPTFDAALQHTFRGCYTSHSQVKQLNRQAEHILAMAEKWSTIARVYGQPYPTEALERAWKHLLFNQFHDIICGTSIPRAYDDVRFEMSEAIGTARRVTHAAQQVIAQRIDTRSSPEVTIEETMRRVRTGAGNAVADLGDGVPVVVFNSSPCPRREVIDVELNDWHIMDLRVQDEQQRPVVHQFAHGEAGPPRKRVAFLAEVPPLGYRLYRVTDEPPHQPGPDARPLNVAPTVLENSWWRLEFDARTGALRSLRDQQLGRELLSGAGAQLLVIEDPSNPWGKGAYFRHLAGVFGQPELSLLESGPVRATIRVTTRWGQSTAQHDFTLYRDIPAIHGRLQLDWHEEYRMVKLAFPFALENAQATFSVPFGHTERPAGGQEEPSQAWLNVKGSLADMGRHTQANVHQLGDETASMQDAPASALPYGVALLNDGKYGADVQGGELRLSIVRSPIYGGGDRPERPRPVDEYLDQGVTRTRWALIPHQGGWQEHMVVQAAQDFNEPLSFVREYAHAGDLPPVQSYLNVEPPGAVIVTALKNAEEGDDLILRLYEPHHRTAHVCVTLPLIHTTLSVTVRPHEIKTLRVTQSGTFREVNFLEEDFA